jgi:N-acetylmuramoyl-L-alanine amidase
MGIITGEGVRMRSSMDKTSKANIIDKFAKGTRVEILERNGEWVKARVKGKVGYIASQYVMENFGGEEVIDFNEE